jgi:hypothetical protein
LATLFSVVECPTHAFFFSFASCFVNSSGIINTYTVQTENVIEKPNIIATYPNLKKSNIARAEIKQEVLLYESILLQENLYSRNIASNSKQKKQKF